LDVLPSDVAAALEMDADANLERKNLSIDLHSEKLEPLANPPLTDIK